VDTVTARVLAPDVIRMVRVLSAMPGGKISTGKTFAGAAVKVIAS
jgi:hypothetical protein